MLAQIFGSLVMPKIENTFSIKPAIWLNMSQQGDQEHLNVRVFGQARRLFD